jgi:hypothetical protein
MNRLRVAALLFATMACGPEGGIDLITTEGTAVNRQSLAVDNLYNQLRALEYAVPPVPATQNIDMGRWAAGGNFSGPATTCQIVFEPVKHKQCLPPSVNISAINAILVFNVPNGVTLTANGKSVASSNGQAILDVGNAQKVDWKLQSGAFSYSDTLFIRRVEVAGMGAFTIAAMPVSIIYEPPQNQALTNSASIQFLSESTVIDTISKGSGSTNTPRWIGGEAAMMVGQKMASITPVTRAAWPIIQGIIGALSSQPEMTYGVEVNSDHTLSVKMTDSQMVTTAAHRGPGRGDLIAFYKNARVMWGMDAGQITLTLLDHAGLSIFTAEQLRADIAALANGGVAVSGLDAETLTALIALDPMANTSIRGSIFGGPVLSASRFTKDITLQVNGASYVRTVSHSITTSDRTSKLQTTSTVTDSHGGWLTLLGIGEQTGGKTTTKVSLGASRTTSSTQTKSASIRLDAAATETYKVDVNYDNVFGTFLTRTPPAPIVLPPIGISQR